MNSLRGGAREAALRRLSPSGTVAVMVQQTQTKPSRRKAGEIQEPPASRAEQRERTRTAIIESAIEVFAEVGYDAARTRTMAARAKANHGLVHYYFSSKSKLWKAAIEYLFDQAQADMAGQPPEQSSDEADEVAQLRALIRRYVVFSQRYPQYARILFDEGRKRTPRLEWMIGQYLKRNYDSVEVLIRKLQAQGRLPPISPLVLQYMMFGMAHTLFTLAPEVKLKTGVDPLRGSAMVEEQIAAIEALMLRPPEASSGS